MRFSTKMEHFLDDIAYLVSNVMSGRDISDFERKQLNDLHETIEETQKHLKEPLRVAISGFMKAGKSTIMNALLKEKMVYTGSLVTTYTVTWFKYGEEKRVEIVFKNGTTEQCSIDEIENWTVLEKAKKNARVKQVEYLVIYYPNEILKRIELIDTPGLFSSEDDENGDSQNAINFLGIKKIEEINQQNEEEVSKADAIIYAFGRGFKQDDLRVVKAFSTTSINAVGIFSKVDQSFWDCYHPEQSPNDVVMPVIKRLSGELRENIYRILPVSALGVEGSLGLTDEHWETLKEIAELDDTSFTKIIADAENFAHRVYKNIAIEPERREPLLNLLGQYGIYLVRCAIRENVSRKGITDYLYKRSGLDDAYRMILQHFGNRSYIIKTEGAIRKMEAIVNKLEYHCYTPSKKVLEVCDTIHEKMNELRRDNCFVELECLKAYYSGKFTLPQKRNLSAIEAGVPDLTMDEKFLHIMGEYGRNCAFRLGFERETSIENMKNAALSYIADWSPLTGMIYPKSTNYAAKTVITRLQEMYMHLDALCDDVES